MLAERVCSRLDLFTIEVAVTVGVIDERVRPVQELSAVLQPICVGVCDSDARSHAGLDLVRKAVAVLIVVSDSSAEKAFLSVTLDGGNRVVDGRCLRRGVPRIACLKGQRCGGADSFEAWLPFA